MNILRKLTILAVTTSISLFGNTANNISILVEEINNTSDIEVKSELKKKLEAELSSIDTKNLPNEKEGKEKNLQK